MKGTAETHKDRAVPTIRISAVLIAIVILSLIIACASATPQTQQRPAVGAAGQARDDARTGGEKGGDRSLPQERNPRYELCKGDVFDLTFPVTPEFNQTVTVQPDGYITLTGLGDLYVAGKTVPELRELLHTNYAKLLHDPVINVVVKDFVKPYFIAGGQVAHPGKYDLREDMTLTEAIAIAGGFTESSKHSQVLLFRRVSKDWVEVKKLDVKKMFQAANLTEDLHLRPGDMFFVPQNRISKIQRYIPSPGVGMSLGRY